MKDADLYSRILDLAELWFVEAAELDTAEGRVDIRVEHGVLQVGVPWAEAKGRFTLLMKRLIIDVLTECATLTGARRIMRITWNEAGGAWKGLCADAGNANNRIPRGILALTRRHSAKGTTTRPWFAT
ncbi:MAG: transposase family protein [Desulfovibrionaceae bacterium]|nr:transposase family protein [Desulfovibrionaceae bacterium]MBF0514696.1 transposase family protein [Desulfovibrionaceae bacterium]